MLANIPANDWGLGGPHFGRGQLLKGKHASVAILVQSCSLDSTVVFVGLPCSHFG